MSSMAQDTAYDNSFELNMCYGVAPLYFKYIIELHILENKLFKIPVIFPPLSASKWENMWIEEY